VDEITRYILAEEPEAKEYHKSNLRHLAKNRRIDITPEDVTRAVFLEIGAPDHLYGHEIAIRAITLIVEDRKYLDHLTKDLYPTLAKEFDSTPARIERSIRHLVETVFTRGPYENLNRYFGNICDENKGKATNGEFLGRLANVVRVKMREDL
jgi:two-component system response regulator (stage 0 sporulation protein A)